MSTNFPYSLDSDLTLPRIDDNITQLGSLAINSIRSAIFAIEANLGIGAAGAAASVAARLNTSLDPNGNILPSALVNLLSIVQITNEQVAAGAAIQESKLNLSYSTASLNMAYETLKTSVDNLNGFLSLTGVKLEPHIDGTDYNHLLSAILVDPTTAFVKTSPTTKESAGTNVVNRNTSNSDTLVQDISNDLVVHEKSDSSAGVTPTAGGTVPPQNYAHVAAGVYVNSASFTTIPQSNENVQDIIDYIDGSSLLLLGSRVQNFYVNGVSQTSRSSSLLADGYGAPIVPPTPCTSYFLNGNATSPVDNYNFGDDVILFNPTSSQLTSFNFDAQFAQVSPGDLLTINYGTGISYQFVVDSVKAIINSAQNPPIRQYAVRINGKNPVADGYAVARIDNAVFNRNKYGVLATCRAPQPSGFASGIYESLIVINPRSAITLGNGFNASQFDQNHYNLYLTLLPNGDLSNILSLPPVDVTGNQGATPGAYTLDSIVDSINAAFRAPGYNYRFNAFEYDGQIGIALDQYNNASFSIVSGVTDGYGNYASVSNALYPNNVVDNYNVIDPLGFGFAGSGSASPPPSASYQNVLAAAFAPTLLFYPLSRNYFYVNGSEIERLKSDPLVISDLEDAFGDGYWPATITAVSTNPTTVSITYQVSSDLATSGLAAGKTIVVQPTSKITNPALEVNYGRFLISNINFNPCMSPTQYTNITVYDAVHGTGLSPYAVLPVGSVVNLYFSDDSVSFDAENVYDGSTSPGFGNPSNLSYKRFFEVYVDDTGHTTTHERARFSTNVLVTAAGIASLNLYRVSPKLAGYRTNANDAEIRLLISSFSQSTGFYTGQLGRWNPGSSTFTNLGPATTGKQGEIVRFYDETNIDYIDFTIGISQVVSGFTNQFIDIQLFPSLELDQQFMLVASCQVNDTGNAVSYLKDERQFGNVSEEQFTDSALEFITSNPRHTMQNGIVRGFGSVDGYTSGSIITNTTDIRFTGGLSLVNGNMIATNPFTINIPLVQDNNGGAPVFGVLFAICVNCENEVQLIPLTDYNSVVNAINNPGRQLQLFNVATNVAYYVDSTTFSTLVNTRKDLTPLWLVNSQVASATDYSLTLIDARKFVVDANANTQMVFTGANSQGNFQSLSALGTWATYNSAYQSNALLRGALTNPVFPGGINYTGDGCTITLTASTTLSSNTSFTNCNVVITSNTGFVIPVNASNISFTNCTFTYTPTFTPSPANNIVNSGSAAIYSSVTSLKNVSVTGCTFTTNTSSRPPFISFKFNSESYSYAQTVHIANNKFYNTSGVDDVSAVIAFTSTITATQPTEGLKLIDCVIQNNICDKNQLISITGTFNGGGTMLASVVPIATRITGNTCGTISVTGVADNDRNYETGTTGIAYDKAYGVIISDNTCRFIGMLNSVGISCFNQTKYVTPAISFNSCPLLIQRNQCSWIQVIPNVTTAPSSPDTTAYQQNAVVSILDNSLRAYQASGGITSYFLAMFSVNQANFDNAAIAVLAPYQHQVQAIIRGNTVMQGSALNSSNGVVTYDYVNCVYGGADMLIDANIFNNLQSGYDMVYIRNSAAPYVSITNNQFYRNGAVINSYINYYHPANGVVSGNTFDSSTIDNVSNTALIAGSLANISLGPNYNYLTTRSIVQPIVFYPQPYVVSSPTITNTAYPSNGFEATTAPGLSGYFEMTKVINGATLSSITFTYYNSVMVTTASTISFYAVSSTGGNANRINITGGAISMSTTAGPGSTTVTISGGLVIDDSTYSYNILVSNNDGSASVFWYAPILNFTGILYPGQN